MRWLPWSLQSVVTLAAALACATDAARILAVETMAGVSHWNFMSGVLRALVDSGHTITAFTPFPTADGDRPRDNYTEVDLSRELLVARDNQLADIVQKWRTPVGQALQWARRSRYVCDMVYGHPAMRDLLRLHRRDGRPPFDVVIVEPFLSDCVSYVAGQLGVPLIFASALPAIGLMERLHTGHVPNPATASHLVAGHGVPKTFAQRLTNSALFAYNDVAIEYAERVLKCTDPKEYDTAPTVTTSLMFINGHYVSEPPNPVLPSIIHVGGIHLRPPKELPEDILEFIEQSSHGVIYFTFGSTVKMSSIPEHIRNAFIDVLAQIPQRVLWKYEDELENKPKNVMMKKWLPQRDILMHPKVKLFISHGGISGLYEAVDAGVPVLGFPLFGDQ
ncbi:PREDICTED: UDP-glucuronosyltransferase 2C1-like, partial [Diuraphis noxia]|uniref:UDP-glucuronosyltransferase 2C1-like n=1 Tax=Diuraphis noxia TaxID=143948 RepID=UPI0007635D33